MNVKNTLNGIVRDLREKRLWPVALLLLAALVAVPVLLSKSSSTPVHVGQAPVPGGSAPRGTALPAVSVKSAATSSHLRGGSRDPFTQQGGHLASGTAGAASSSSAATASSTSTGPSGTGAGTTQVAGSSSSSGSTSAGGTSSGASTSGGTSSPNSTTSGSPPPSITTGKPKQAPSGLTAKQSYGVTLAMTNSSGGLDTTDSLQRLSVLPTAHEPLLVELGVLKGGNRVLFVVQPGAVVKGPGKCMPGPVDCEILSLAAGQTEQLEKQSLSGVAPVNLFAVTQITADRHPSVAAADKARRAASDAGRRLLTRSTLNTLSLFQYKPSLGAVLDLRNLTVGGN